MSVARRSCKARGSAVRNWLCTVGSTICRTDYCAISGSRSITPRASPPLITVPSATPSKLRMSVSRRGFLQSASASLGVALLDGRTSAADDLEKTFTEIRANLLEMVNEERVVAKLNPLAVDELATQVATKHAQEMAAEDFASHWGRDGRKPYHRYSFAGGTQATQ